MTLILTVANREGVYQSSDYQLTDAITGAPVSDRAGAKQLEANFKEIDLRVAFTGVAAVPSSGGTCRTVDWLAETLRAMPEESTLPNVCAGLAARCSHATAPLGQRGVLELVVTAAQVGKPFRVAVISNVDWRARPPRARMNFRVTIRTIARPFVLVSGFRSCVSDSDEHRLHAVARSRNTSVAKALDTLVEVNATAAKRSGGCVSSDCLVSSQTADGRARRSSSRNVGEHPGEIKHLIGGLDVAEFIRKNFRAAPGREITLVQSAGVMVGPGGGTPLPARSGERSRFVLVGGQVRGDLRTPSGEKTATIEIETLRCEIEARCNEQVICPLVMVRLRAERVPTAPFPPPLYPWPQLSHPFALDATPIPRGWEYSVGYWFENARHRLVIPESHRAIRNVSFLAPTEELVVIAPSTSVDLTWTDDDPPPVTVQARVWWRSRVDGTVG